MEKLVISFVVILSAGLIGLGVYGYLTNKKQDNVTLENIAQTFENSVTIKTYEDNGQTVSTTTTENRLTIIVGETTYKYTLNGNILTTTMSKDDLGGSMMLLAVVDSVGQLHGYTDGQTFPTLNSEDIKNYTISKGFELIESGDKITANIDINKKLELIDFTGVYIETVDLNEYADTIKGSGFAQISKGNVTFYKTGDDTQSIITIGEKDKLTNSAYNSLLSTIEFLYGKTELDSFESNYPSLVNKTFDKYKLEVNPTKSDMESFLFGEGYEIVRLTIDKTA